MIKRHLLLPLALTLSLFAGACADSRVSYITAGQIDTQHFPAAPQKGSDTDTKDLAVLHDWQNKRTSEQCSKALSEGHAEFLEFFGDISPFSTPLPAEVNTFFKRVKNQTDDIVSLIKDRDQRPRPFNRDSTLSPCIGRVLGYSYPSGHATISRVMARILAELVPDKKDIYMSRGDECALYRVIGGVHHPSDIEAGKNLGDAVFEQMMTNSAFKKDIESLRQYIK